MSAETKTTTEWRSSFRSVRDRFGTDSAINADPPPIFTSGIGDIESRRRPAQSFYSFGSQTLPRRLMGAGVGQGNGSLSPLSKSSSTSTIIASESADANERSVLSDAIENRRAREAPEQREQQRPIRNQSSELNSFWLNNCNRANSSAMAAAASGRVSPFQRLLRFDELNDIIDESAGTIERRRRSSGESSAAKRVQFLRETFKPTNMRPSMIPTLPKSSILSGNILVEPVNNVNNRSQPLQFLNPIASFTTAATDETLACVTDTDIAQRTSYSISGNNGSTTTSVSSSTSNGVRHQPLLHSSSPSTFVNNNEISLNFSALDSAVAEMQPSSKINLTQTTTQRFPLNCDTLSPVQRSTTNIITTAAHSPSPDTLSQNSDYSPSGLPCPRPKHHIREQLLSIGIEPRSPQHYHPRPATYAFPVPTTGNVASRISEIEKRPNTTLPNLLQIACALQNATPVSHGPMSPRMAMSQSTVYRTKPVIHVQMVSSSSSSSSSSKSPVHSPRYSSIAGDVKLSLAATNESLFNFSQVSFLLYNQTLVYKIRII